MRTEKFILAYISVTCFACLLGIIALHIGIPWGFCFALPVLGGSAAVLLIYYH